MVQPQPTSQGIIDVKSTMRKNNYKSTREPSYSLILPSPSHLIDSHPFQKPPLI